MYLLVHDNCPSFTAEECRLVVGHLNLPCMFTNPASFQGLMVEGCFMALKSNYLTEEVKNDNQTESMTSGRALN